MGAPVGEFVELVTTHQKEGMRVAEIGVFEGDSTLAVLPIIQKNNGVLVAVDQFRDNENHGMDYTKTFINKIAPWLHVCRVIEGVSWEVADHFADEWFDLVFIDADHKYTSVIRDLYAWYPKVKVGGIFCGHDYDARWDGTNKDLNEQYVSHFGVTKAVRECLPLKFKLMGSEVSCQTWYSVKKG